MPIDSDARHRGSIRLPGYDYGSEGAYFVTMVVRERECLFADAALLEIVDSTWRWLADRYDFVRLDEYVVMPNHLHGIVTITGPCRGGSRTAPTPPRSAIKPLGQLIGAFKTVSSKQINALRDRPGLPVWQRNYYEHIIRNEDELNRIRQYILDNPANWHQDAENPAVPSTKC